MEFNCYACQYKHGGCHHDLDTVEVENCKDFKVGGCFSCKYYYGKMGLIMTDEEMNRWYARGCDTRYPSALGCHKRKRLSRKRKKRMKKCLAKYVKSSRIW